jgi:hypothetical protein
MVGIELASYLLNLAVDVPREVFGPHTFGWVKASDPIGVQSAALRRR